MEQKILLITPPFTQLNTPYPATCYLKGFLRSKGVQSFQLDLSLELMLAIFTRPILERIFEEAAKTDDVSEHVQWMLAQKDRYLQTVEPAMRFLQNRDPTLAHRICMRSYLPEGDRFLNLEDLQWAFGTMGIQDQARHLVTLYLEDLGDLISETVDPHFGFTRYGERLSTSLTHLDPLLSALETESLLTGVMLRQLQDVVEQQQPSVVCFTIPFPGNLFSALQCARWLKKHHPEISIVMGGGYCNTELRDLSDVRLFDLVDYVCLDDGEAPLWCLLDYLDGNRPANGLKRTFMRRGGMVCLQNGADEKDFPQRETGTPDYGDLKLDKYLSFLEVINPMHRLWNDGRWNKLTMAHGCYWGKCTFCDISLDYIARYEPLTAAILCDRMQQLIEQTGETGFHFVDEAAPPALMRKLALEILARKQTVSWWTNIRFEKSFTADLCRLLHASGCIAVSGGLEVASDRLLKLIQKGVTVAQVAAVADALTQSGIMVHAYLMYGFPTQSEQETMDSLEMVRQMFAAGILQSAYWHLFAMTAHSPVGRTPAQFGVERLGPAPGGFANNDLQHADPEGADHEQFGPGLRKALFNYMHGIGLDEPLNSWFDFEVPLPRVSSSYIADALERASTPDPGPRLLLVWIEPVPFWHKEDGCWYLLHDGTSLGFVPTEFWETWVLQQISLWLPENRQLLTWKAYADLFREQTGTEPTILLESTLWDTLRDTGLCLV